ncbi:MAG: DUF3971 domain-containing protein [Gammaproteobacteria bacterium]|nr:DUF3971 domain-containing protein [Gammaproteobacteria bacterium]
MSINSSETQPDTVPDNRLNNLPNSSFKNLVVFIWHFHRKLIIALIILLAAVLILLRSLAYYLETNPRVIENFIESQLHSQVTFEQIKVNVKPFFPSVVMQNFAIRDVSGEGILEFSSASITLNVPLSIIHGHTVIDTLVLDGISALIRRKSNGEISIAKLQLTNAEKNISAADGNETSYTQFFNQKNFIITNSEMMFIDEMQEYPSSFFTDINFKMKNKNDRHQVSFQARMNATESRLNFQLDFYGRIENIKNWDGQAYGEIENLNQQTILHFLKEDVLQIEDFRLNDIEANTKVWSSIESGKLQSIHGELFVKDARLTRVDREQAINFDFMETNFKLERHNSLEHINNTSADIAVQENNWSIDLFDLNLNIDSKPITQKHINLKYQKNINQLFPQAEVFINVLDFGELSPVVSFFSPKKLNTMVYPVLKPRGRLKNIVSTVKLKSLDMPIDIINYQVQMDVENLSVNSFQSIPKVRNFSAQVLFNENKGQAIIDNDEMELHIKSLFRDTWPITQLTGEIYWQKDGVDWLLGGENLSVKNPHLQASADLKLWFAENGQTFMDLTGFYHDANVQYVSYYLPVTIMSDGLVKWLDESIISGWGTDGGVVYRGNLSQFPYEDHSGAMDIVFNTSDVVLEFQKNWPKLTDINARVQFTEQGMAVEAQHSKIISAVSENIQVDIKRYLQPELRIKGDISSSIDDAVHFLQQSRLVSRDVLAILDARDDININLDLSIPLKKHQPDSKVRIRFNNADYYPPGFDRKKGLVTKLKGDVMVHNQSITAKKLTANIMGHPARIAIKTTGLSPGSKKDPPLSVAIDSKVSVKQLKKFNLLPLWLKSVTDRLSGSSKIHLAIDLPNRQRALAFNISSDLQGLTSSLPAPLAKQAGASSSFNLNFAQVMSSARPKKELKKARLTLDIADILSLALLFDTSAEEFSLLKGNVFLEGGRARLPEQNTLKLSGSLTKAPLDQWQAIFAAQKDVSSRKNTIKTNRQNRSGQKPFIPIQLAMTELVLPELKLNVDKKKKSASKTVDTLDPRQFPLLNGSIDSLKLGKAELGKFTIQSKRIAQGIAVDSISLQGDVLSAQSNAKWHLRNSKPEVELKAEVMVPSMEELFKRLGYEQLMRAGEAKFAGDVSWPGSPADFSKQSVNGTLYVRVNKGAYLEGKPGAAGRLLGLLNMNALARRISLDFSDVSDKGYRFDKIKGDFSFSNGNAKTDNLRINAPSAKILVTGRVGMVSEDVEQRVTVIPEVSATLPIAGAAVAGPAGAAVVWVGQKLLGKHLNKITAIDYTVTGSWQDPVIKRDKITKNTLVNAKKLLGLDKVKETQVDIKETKPTPDSNSSGLP